MTLLSSYPLTWGHDDVAGLFLVTTVSPESNKGVTFTLSLNSGERTLDS